MPPTAPMAEARSAQARASVPGAEGRRQLQLPSAVHGHVFMFTHEACTKSVSSGFRHLPTFTITSSSCDHGVSWDTRRRQGSDSSVSHTC